MSWSELRLLVPRTALGAASELLFQLGSAGLQEEEPGEATRRPRQEWEAPEPEEPASSHVLLRAWFEAPDRALVTATLAAALPGARELVWHELPDTDWAEGWKQAHAPIEVEGLVIAPPWDAPPGALVIEPGQGFGTGQHPTTRLVLAELVRVVRSCPGLASALDVGCGSGVLALAAARLGLRARGVDVEPAAVEEARQNAARNGLPASFSTAPVAALDEGADVVLANLHAEVLLELASELVRLARRWLLLGGVLLDREERVRAAFADCGALASRREEAGWVALTYRIGEGAEEA